MVDENLRFLDENFRVKILELGEQSDIKVGSVSFRVGQYLIREVGNLTILKGSAMLGLVKKDILILTPYQVDAPILYYERNVAKGIDTMSVEFFHTMLNSENPGLVKNLQIMKETEDIYATTYPYSSGDHWYDKYKLDISMEKQGKKSCKDIFDQIYRQMFIQYMDMLKEAESCDKAEKIEKISSFAKKLYSNGGSKIDAFQKEMGEEGARKFFDDVMFGITKGM